MNPRFTIITCTLNSEKYLRDSIKSVISQSFKEIEYIFVDGGSTDGTLEIISKVPVNKKLIENVTGGISKAMNVGIQAASGEIIAHLHSDDYYLSTDVLKIVDSKFKENQAEWLFGGLQKNIDGKEVPLDYIVPEYSYKNLLKGNFIPHPSTFVKKSLFDRVGGFNENLRYAMDYDMWLRLGSLADPIQINNLIAVFRVHSGSLTSSKPLAGMDEVHKIRMSQAGITTLNRLEFYLRHLVRKGRQIRRMSQSK